MANRDAPMGFTPVGLLNGKEIPVRRYPLVSTHVRVGIGDMIECLSTGNVDVDDDPATTPTKILGACVGIYDSDGIPITTRYLVASTGGYVDVALAIENAIFSAQADGTVIEIDRFSCADTANTACDTTTGRSKQEISATAQTGEAGNWLVIDKVDEPGNAWGDNVKLLVIPAEGYFVGAGGAVRVGI